MWMVVQILAPVLALALLAAGGLALRRCFRFRRPLRATPTRVAALREFASKLDRELLLPCFAYLFLGAGTATGILHGLASLWYDGLTGTLYFLDPVTPRAPWLKYLVPTGFVVGFGLAGWLTMRLVVRRYGRAVAARYIVAGRVRYRFRYDQAFRTGLAVASFLCVPLFVLELDWYMRVCEDGIVVNEFWALGERKRKFVEVHAVVETTHLTTKSGREVERPQYHILFADGSRWSQDPAFEDYRPAIEYVSRKAGRPVRQTRLIEDIRGP